MNPVKHLLLSNDDGINAPGLAALHEAVSDMGKISVVAPEAEQSAIGHAITIAFPILAKPHEPAQGPRGFAVTGTPADCIKLAVNVLLKEKPDLVLSGINLGSNVGVSVIYSGTISAATEGLLMGIPSMAISLCGSNHPLHWDTAAAVARCMLTKIISNGLPPATLLNVNVPNKPLSDLRGFAVTRMGQSRFIEKFERRVDPRGNEYFWLDGNLKLLENAEQTDILAIQEGFVSITPIGLDRTRHNAIPTIESWNLKLQNIKQEATP